VSSAGASLQVLLSWFSFGVRSLVLLAVIGAALGPIRRGNAGAGFALAAAAAIDGAILAAWRVGVLMLQSRSAVADFDTIFTVLNVASLAAHMAAGALLAAAMVMLAGTARRR